MKDAMHIASDDIQADDDILTGAVSDEALEAAAGTQRVFTNLACGPTINTTFAVEGVPPSECC